MPYDDVTSLAFKESFSQFTQLLAPIFATSPLNLYWRQFVKGPCGNKLSRGSLDTNNLKWNVYSPYDLLVTLEKKRGLDPIVPGS